MLISLESQGSAAGRLQTELLERTIASVVKILMDAGKLQPMKIDGKMVTIKFTSPAARRPDADEVSVVLQGIEIANSFPPEVVQREYNIGEAFTYTMDKLGMPASFKKSEQEKQQYDQQQQAMMQTQMQMQGGEGEV